MTKPVLVGVTVLTADGATTGTLNDDDSITIDAMPKPVVRIIGRDGNAFAILGACHKALKAAGRAADVPKFDAQATAGNYDHLLATVADWFDVR